MTRPTEILMQEHRAIEQMLAILESACRMLEAGQSVDAVHLGKMIEFIKVFADTCHHGKEEEFLFPALENAGIPRNGGPVGVMLAEHDQGRRYIRNLTSAVENYKKGSTSAASDIIANARNYIALLTGHIQKEDSILFRMADMHLPETVQTELIAKFERLENEKIGAGKHEQFHQLLTQLKEIYLGPPTPAPHAHSRCASHSCGCSQN